MYVCTYIYEDSSVTLLPYLEPPMYIVVTVCHVYVHVLCTYACTYVVTLHSLLLKGHVQGGTGLEDRESEREEWQ